MYPPPLRSPSLRIFFQRKNERILCIAAISSQPVPSAVASPREAFCGLEDRDLIEFNDRRHWPKDDPGHPDCRWDADLQVRGQWRDEVDGAPVAPPGRHCAREPAHARFLGLDMQLLHRVRWLVRLHDETGSIHHYSVKIAKRHEKLKAIKISSSDSSLSASSKRHFARDGSFSAFSSSPQISRYISRIQHVFVIALQHLASFLGTFGLLVKSR